MLRVNVRSFARRNAEKLRVELVDLVEESAPFNKRLSGNGRLAVVVSLHIPSIRRHIADCVPAFHQQLPKRLRVVNSAGKAASDSYDSDAIFVHKWPVSRKPNDKLTSSMANGKQLILTKFIE